MAETILAIAVGIKLSVFIILLVYSLLINIILKDKKVHGIALFAVAFIAVALIEFFEVTADLDAPETGEEEHQGEDIYHILGDVGTIIAGLGLVGFLVSMNKNIKDYR